MKLISPKIKICNITYKDKLKDNGDSYKYAIVEVGDEVTQITEDLFVSSNCLDLLKDLKQGDLITIELKNSNGRFTIKNIVKEK